MKVACLPGFRDGTDAPQPGEAAFQPGLEGRDTIIAEHAELAEDLHGAFAADPVAAQRGEQPGVADLVTVGMAGQQDDQAAIGLVGYPAAPAAGLADRADVGAQSGQPGVGEVGVAAPVEPGAGRM